MENHHNVNGSLNYLRQAGIQWNGRVRRAFAYICSQLKLPVSGKIRETNDHEEIKNKWDSLSKYQIDLSKFRPVYAPKDLLEALLSLKTQELKPQKKDTNEIIHSPKWEFSHIAIKVKNLSELKSFYGEVLRYTGQSDLSLHCQKILNTKHSHLCQQILKRGNTPPLYRGALWSYVLGSHVNTYHIKHWEHLKSTIINTDHIVDKLIFKDIQLTASNDDQYFVFEDILYQIMLCFSRDIEVAEIIQAKPIEFKGRKYEGPPSGIIPFHGICMYAAPFCYLFESPIKLYFAFRAFFIRYFYRLTIISPHPQGIVSLCLLFEKLLQVHEIELWTHFKEINIQPIKVVFKWLMRAFSGYLPTEQLLTLWDLVLGFDSLEIFPLFAIIILSFRKKNLLKAKSFDDIEAILSDLSTIKVLPLIQLALSEN